MITWVKVSSEGDSMNDRYQELQPDEAKKLMERNPQSVVLDVRDEIEFVRGHVKRAILLPIHELTATSAEKVIPDKETMVFVYCYSGVRSKEAAARLADYGYSNIYKFDGVANWPYDLIT